MSIIPANTDGPEIIPGRSRLIDPEDFTELTQKIDFSEHPYILAEVKRLAAETVRTPAQQIIYILKTHLERHQQTLSDPFFKFLTEDMDK